MSWSLADISEKMRHIDFAMLMTHAPDGGLAGRPMQGQADGHLSGYYILLTKGFDAEGRFATTDLTIGQEQLDRLLVGGGCALVDAEVVDASCDLIALFLR